MYYIKEVTEAKEKNMDIKDIAKSIRTVLKSTFPATKFRVTISRFSQGSSADLSWTDGPIKTQVNDLISSYGTRSQFINTDRSQSMILTSKAVAAWKVQNSKYAHLAITYKGGTECYGIELDGFDSDSDVGFCEDSLNEFIRNSTFDSVNSILATTPEVKTTSKVETVETPAPQPELKPSQPDALEVLAEPAPNNQVSELEAELLNVQELLKKTRKLVDTLESEAYRLTIQITAANLAQLANKAEIKQIILTRDEGTIAESGTTITATSWLKAERTLKQWARTVISPTRADKCRIVFEFADGESFKLSSFELMQKHRFGVNLSQKLLAELQYMAGEVIPAHMTRQDYENFCKFCKINPDVYKRLLNNWAIPA